MKSEVLSRHRKDSYLANMKVDEAGELDHPPTNPRRNRGGQHGGGATLHEKQPDARRAYQMLPFVRTPGRQKIDCSSHLLPRVNP